jgi:WD40 repeat protein
MVVLGAAGALSPSAAAAPGSQLWVGRYDGPASSIDVATALVADPNGGRVFVTGFSVGDSTGTDYATVAYDASTGAMLWAKRYDGGQGGDRDQPAAIAVDPGGSRVFVTGFSNATPDVPEWATIAYDASTGARLWVRRFDGPDDLGDDARAIDVSPDGATVFVAGVASVAGSSDSQTLAYRASDGSRIWSRRYNGPGDGLDGVAAIAASPDGSAVFVTGTSDGAATFADYATVAYAASDGATLWTKRHNDSIDGDDFARAVGVSPDGALVFVTGSTAAVTRNDNYTTIAYAADTGTKIWQKSYNGPPDSIDRAYAIAVSTDGVYVTGYSHGGSSTHFDYATVAYKASDGTGLWTRRFNGPASGDDRATAIAVDPNGSAVTVTGGSFSATTFDDYATVSYDAVDGSTLWVKRYQRPRGDIPSGIVVSPDGSRIFVTGSSSRPATSFDYATVAYATV